MTLASTVPMASPAPEPAALAPELGGHRLGSVPYLNAAPLVFGLGPRVRLSPPSLLAEGLRSGALDAGLVSISEVLENDLYHVVEGAAVGSDGPVFSVLLAHRVPLEEIRRIACDPASLTSVRLLQLLLAERGLRPEFIRADPAARGDAFLIIGDPAIAFRQSAAAADYALWDLGAAWRRLTGLPFVFAAWAVRRELRAEALATGLREVKSAGVAHLDAIIRARPEFDLATREQYLRRHIRYELGAGEKRGISAFAHGLTAYGVARVFPVQWL